MITQKVRMQIADLAEKYGYQAGIMPSEALNGWRAGHELIVIAPKSVKKSIKNLNSTIIAIIGEGSVFNHHKVVLADNPKYAMVHVEREGKKVDQYLGTANSDSELVERIQEQLVWVTIPKRAIETSSEPKGIGSVPKVPAALQKFANEVDAYAYPIVNKQGSVYAYEMKATPTDNYIIVAIEDVSKVRGGNIFRGKWEVAITGGIIFYARNMQEITELLSSHKSHIKKAVQQRKGFRKQDDSEQRGVGRIRRRK